MLEPEGHVLCELPLKRPDLLTLEDFIQTPTGRRRTRGGGEGGGREEKLPFSCSFTPDSSPWSRCGPSHWAQRKRDAPRGTLSRFNTPIVLTVFNL